MSVNKVILIGNVGQEPKVTTFRDGGSVAQFSLATTKRGYTRQDGTPVEARTEWHNIVVSGGQTKVVSEYVHKGTKLYIEGELRTRTYDKDGATRYVTEIYASVLELLTPKPSSEPQQAAPIDDVPF